LQLVLCTNYLPKTDKTWSVALRRRLQLVCFIKQYFSPHEKGYDPNNPLHGEVDTRLLAKLTTEPNMQELLAWLVAGAVKWYENGQQLYPMPKRSEDALREYEEENDDFEAFVLNSCIVGEDLFIKTKDVLDVYHNQERKVNGEFVGKLAALNNKSLKAVMNNHGYKGPGKPSELGVAAQYSGLQDRGYKGLALKPPGEYLGELY
jgi:phage/plasmid-associated DNA primase